MNRIKINTFNSLPLLIILLLIIALYYSFFLLPHQQNWLAHYFKKDYLPIQNQKQSLCIPNSVKECKIKNCTGVSKCIDGEWGPCIINMICTPGSKAPCVKNGCGVGYKICNECGTGYGECIYK